MRFEDTSGHASKLRVLDWETGQLFWNYFHAAKYNEQVALAKAKQKYLDSFFDKDPHSLVGTTQPCHFIAPNPWVIIGAFPIPHERQVGLF